MVHDPDGSCAPVGRGAPPGEPLSEDYTVVADGAPIPVFPCRVSAVFLNQVWPGYQRPMDQTEMAAFASWEATGSVDVAVTCSRPVESVVVRPLARRVTTAVHADTVAFRLPGPGQYTVEADGWHRALHLFVDPPEEVVPQASDPKVRYFPPGVHRPGRIDLESGQTVYVARGAVVYGSIHARRARDVHILGRGIVDVSEFERGQGGGAIRLEDCTDITIDGLVLRDPDVWCCSLFGCRRARIRNVKLVGLWRYNADGIDLCNSEQVRVSDCFVRAFDDCIVLKGLRHEGRDPDRPSYHERSVRDILVERCVVWNDWGRGLEIGAETSAPEIADVVFRDCDLIRTTHIAMDIQHGDRATVRDILFEDIRVESDARYLQPRIQQTRDEIYGPDAEGDYRPRLLCIVVRPTPYSRDGQAGVVRDVVFRNVSLTGPLALPSTLDGVDAEHDVAGVVIDDLRFNGRACACAEDMGLRIGPHVRDVRLRTGAGPG